MKLVLASGNSKKLVEMRALFEPLGVELQSQSALGISEAPEPHVTFLENALAKARHAARESRCAAIADDSGLCVDALDGAPGVLSARYATLFGGAKGDAQNNAALLERMASLRRSHDRRASFVCVLVALRSADDPEPLVAQGRWVGELLTAQRGEGGFGYDPLLFIPSEGKTVAELPAERKNLISHRAQASREMLALMRERWFA
ncbi:MAG TPA: RdgB/HAM1 family non-canonical purine NTP pyrophosphatase [Burkholderiaceae bacterium]|jgi:XTP/dITP diphosphohydrolase|nr:RdgB/HAM1 family non-canonical purine NTP pyrophosphatase [Burkholderiaceae bacterium]